MHYKEAIKLPFKNWKKLTIAALFFLGYAIASALSQLSSLSTRIHLAAQNPNYSFLVISFYFIGFILSLFVTGYALNIGKKAMKKKFVLPPWKNYGDLLGQGFVSMFIAVVYYLPGIVILGVSIVAGVVGAVGAGASGVFAAVPGITIGVLLLLAAAFMSPAAMLAYAEKWNFSDGFNFRRIMRKTLSGPWVAALFVSFAWSFVIILGLILTTIILSFISPLVTLLFTPLSSAIISITTYAMLGEAYGEVKV
jgi:hypothetical protein